MAFIRRAIELDIVVLCYPPHATHLLQGLDVVLFSVAKAEWSKSRDKFERETGQVVTKETFLKVFGEAYIAAFTPGNNRKAFEKTGVHPFNRDAIDPKDLAPALEHSLHATLPLNVPSPVKRMMDVYRQALIDIQWERDWADGWETDGDNDGDGDGDGSGDEGNSDDGNVDHQSDSNSHEGFDDDSSGSEDAGPVHRVLRRGNAATSTFGRGPSTPQRSHPASSKSSETSLHAGRTPARFRLRSALQNSSPTKALVSMTPSRTPARIPKRTYLHPTIEVNWNSLPRPPTDIYDEADMLRSELAKARARDDQHNVCLESAHSQLAIVGCYAETCRSHAVAARNKRTKMRGRRILSQGHGRILTDADFVAEVERAEAARAEEVEAKEARADARRLREVEAAQEKEYREAKALLWECVKADHLVQVETWEEIGRIGPKPVLPKRKDVWKEYDNEQGRSA